VRFQAERGVEDRVQPRVHAVIPPEARTPELGVPMTRRPSFRDLLMAEEPPRPPRPPPGRARPETIEVPDESVIEVKEAPEPAPEIEAAPEPAPSALVVVPVPATRGPRRPARFGLSIRFEERPDDPELARLVESTVLVNEAHPAYRRAAVSRSEGYHIALATAMALAPLAVEPAKEHAFVTAFLSSWGMAVERPKRRRSR